MFLRLIGVSHLTILSNIVDKVSSSSNKASLRLILVNILYSLTSNFGFSKLTKLFCFLLISIDFGVDALLISSSLLVTTSLIYSNNCSNSVLGLR